MRYLIALILSAGLVMGPGTRAAQAQNDDLAKIIAGLAALAIIGVAIDEAGDRQKDRDRKRKQKVVVERYKPHAYKPHAYKPQAVQRPNRAPQMANWKRLPSHCLRIFQVNNYERRVFGNRCLERNYAHVGRLPGYCRTRFEANGRQRIGYDARCLRNAGFRRNRV